MAGQFQLKGGLFDIRMQSQPAPVQPGSTTEVVHGSGSEHANVLLTWENTASDSRFSSRQKDIHAMRVSHSFPAISATFDDPNLVSCAGLAPTMALQGPGIVYRAVI